MSIQPLLAALRLFRKPLKSGKPRLIVLTDDARGFGLARQVADCPRDAMLIERTYGQRPTRPPAKKARRPIRLASVLPHDARRQGLDGVHWPEKRLRLRRRSQTNGLIETASAHRGLSIAKAIRQDIHSILVSTAFASQSPSAGKPKGPIRLARLQRAFPACHLYALGGLQAKSARRLISTGVYGVALISGLSQ